MARLVAASSVATVSTSATEPWSVSRWVVISAETLAAWAASAPARDSARASTWPRAALPPGSLARSCQELRKSAIAAETPESPGSPTPLSIRASAVARSWR